MAGWSDAAYGDQSSLRKYRLGYLVGLTPRNFCGPRHIWQRASKSRRNQVTGSPGGGGYTFGEMLGRMSMLREFHGHFADLFLGTVGLEECGSPSTRLGEDRMIAEKLLVHLSPAIQEASELEELGNLYRFPGRGNPADGMTQLHSGILPLVRLIESGARNPGFARPPKGVAFGGT